MNGIILGLTLLIVVSTGTWVILHRAKRSKLRAGTPAIQTSRRTSDTGDRHQATRTSKSLDGFDDLDHLAEVEQIDGEASTFAFQVAKALVKQLELEAEEAKQTVEAAREELDTVKVAEAKASAKLELVIATEKEARQTVRRKQERIQELLSQSEEARKAAEEAGKELDTIRIAEAEAMAELDIVLATREKINNDIEAIRPPIQQLQMQARKVREEARSMLNAAKREETEAKIVAENAVSELYSFRKREALAMAESKAARAEEERAKQMTEEVRKHIDYLEAAAETAKSAATEAMDRLHDARVTEARLSAEISAFRAETDEVVSSVENLNAGIQELQAKKRMRSNEEGYNVAVGARGSVPLQRANSAEPGTEQAEIERSGWEAMKHENPLYSPKSMGDGELDQPTEPSGAAVAAG